MRQCSVPQLQKLPLEVAIDLVFIYLPFSLLATALNEGIASLMNKCGTNLVECIKDFFNDPVFGGPTRRVCLAATRAGTRVSGNGLYEAAGASDVLTLREAVEVLPLHGHGALAVAGDGLSTASGKQAVLVGGSQH